MKKSLHEIFDAFRGDKPLPCHSRVTLQFKHPAGGPLSFSQTTLPFGNVAEGIRAVIECVEEESLSSPAMPFREAGAFFFHYADGTAEAEIFTTDQPAEIGPDIHFTAIEQCRILEELDQGRLPRMILHIHTHPGMEYKPAHLKNAPLLINEADYFSYQQFSAFFSAYAGKTVPIDGLVKPVGARCGNAVITTEAVPPCDPDNEMRDEALRAKLRRIPRLA